MDIKIEKEMMYSDEARKKLLQGVRKLSKAVKTTLGPKGRNVVIGRPYGFPAITKDGVTVAKEVDLDDKFENIGAQMVKEVAGKTADVAGDGTTTATVLAESILTNGLKSVTAGFNPMSIKRGVDKATEVLVSKLNQISIPVVSKEQIEQIAIISANGDKTIGSIIADAVDKVGRDGSITVDESGSTETTLDVIQGMQFDQGYLSPYFVTDVEEQTAVFEKPLILLVDKKISSLQEILDIFQAVAQSGRQLLVISDGMDNEVLSTMVLNKMKGTFKACAVKSPYFGDRRKEVMMDLAVLTGATLFSEDVGRKVSEAKLEDLGSANKVVVSKGNTIIIGGAGDGEQIMDRVSAIRKQIEDSNSPYDIERMKERLAKLVGGIAVINVGASTEIELKEKKFRIDDALSATRAAVEEGMVPGGGIALLKASSLITDEFDNVAEEEKVGVKIVLDAITEPFKQLLLNGGYEPNSILKEIKETCLEDIGFNVATGEKVNMYEVGVIDPTKVTRSALQNAASIAGLMLTTECVISAETKTVNNQ